MTTLRGFWDAVAGPFIVFFKTFGWMAVLMLAVIVFYQLPNYAMAPMVTPFYSDLGLSKDVVGGVRVSVGFAATLAGIAAGGISAARFGYMRAVSAGVVLLSLATASFAWLAVAGASLTHFSIVMVVDNFAISFAGVALTTYMSTLTSIGYTATQYALLSSAYNLDKFIKGGSGLVVDYLTAHGHHADAGLCAVLHRLRRHSAFPPFCFVPGARQAPASGPRNRLKGPAI